MPTERPREPHFLPEQPRPAEPETTPDGRGLVTPPAEDTAPHEPNSVSVGSEIAGFAARLAALADAGSTDTRPLPVRDAPPVIPGYEVSGELARGGMGVVYAARDLALNREVAVKTVLPHLVHPQYAAQFDREARLTALLAHPGV